MTTTLDTRAAEAQILAERERWWLAWRAYLAEQRALLERARAPASDDLTIDLTDPLAQAVLPAGLRQELDALLEARRQDALLANPRADADQLLHDLLDQLDAELHGRAHPDGLALVQVGEATVTFDHRAIADQTAPEDLAALVGSARRPRRRRWGWLVLAVLGLLLAMWGAQQLAAPARRVSPAPPTVRIGAADVAVWDIQALAIAGVLIERPRAMLDGAGITVCASADQRAALQPGATVTLTGTTSLRTYQIAALPADPATADLVLADCSGRTPELLAAATLQEARTAAPLDPATLVAVHSWGSDVRPAAIPADQMEVVLVLAPGAPTDGVLLLPDGSSRAPAAASEMTPVGTVVRVLIPRAETPQRMAWQVQGGAGLPQRLPLDVPAPADRAALLTSALQVREARLAPDAAGALQLTLTLELDAGAPPLILLPDDLSVADVQGRAVPARWTPPALTPGTATPVVITLSPGQATPPLEIQLGAWRARVAGTAPAAPSPVVPEP